MATYKIKVNVDGVDGYKYHRMIDTPCKTVAEVEDFISRFSFERWRNNAERRAIFRSHCEIVVVMAYKIKVNVVGVDGYKYCRMMDCPFFDTKGQAEDWIKKYTLEIWPDDPDLRASFRSKCKIVEIY